MKTTIVIGFLWHLMLFSGSAWAVDAETEQAVLARIVHELNAIQPMADEAQNKAFSDSRIRFNYTGLKQDLARIQQGINEYIETPSTEPRSFEPLSGDYRE